MSHNFGLILPVLPDHRFYGGQPLFRNLTSLFVQQPIANIVEHANKGPTQSQTSTGRDLAN